MAMLFLRRFREAQNVVWQDNACVSELTYEIAVTKAREVTLAALAWTQSQDGTASCLSA